jgi:hypothetical protein
MPPTPTQKNKQQIEIEIEIELILPKLAQLRQADNEHADALAALFAD